MEITHESVREHIDLLYEPTEASWETVDFVDGKGRVICVYAGMVWMEPEIPCLEGTLWIRIHHSINGFAANERDLDRPVEANYRMLAYVMRLELELAYVMRLELENVMIELSRRYGIQDGAVLPELVSEDRIREKLERMGIGQK